MVDKVSDFDTGGHCSHTIEVAGQKKVLLVVLEDCDKQPFLLFWYEDLLVKLIM